MSTRRSRRNVPAPNQEAATDIPISMSRARRNVSGAQPVPLAKVSRQPSSPSSQQSLHLTVKLPASKLRQATGMAPPARVAKPSVSLSSREQFVGGEILEGKRARNVKKSYVLESDSEDEEEDEEMEDVADDDDAEGESVEEEEEEEEEEEDDEEMADQDAEGEDDDADADADIDMDIPPPPPPPTIKISRAEKGKKPTISVKPTGKGDGKTVEAKEAAEASDDEELSELESEVEEEEEGMQLGNEEDAEGEEEEDLEEVDDEEEDEEDDELDSDDETPAGGSRASTPDLTKLTKRQRARLEEGGSGHLLALPDGTIF
jgi:Ino eighty subunit 2